MAIMAALSVQYCNSGIKTFHCSSFAISQTPVGRHAASDSNLPYACDVAGLFKSRYQHLDNVSLKTRAQIGKVVANEIGILLYAITQEIKERCLDSAERKVEVRHAGSRKSKRLRITLRCVLIDQRPAGIG